MLDRSVVRQGVLDGLKSLLDAPPEGTSDSYSEAFAIAKLGVDLVAYEEKVFTYHPLENEL